MKKDNDDGAKKKNSTTTNTAVASSAIAEEEEEVVDDEAAIQHATRQSIQNTAGAFAVTPASSSINRRVNNNTHLNTHASGGGGVLTLSSAGTSGRAVASSSYNNIGTTEGGAATNNITPSSHWSNSNLPPNIDIIAVATLVPSQLGHRWGYCDDEEYTTGGGTTNDGMTEGGVDTLGLDINEEPNRGGANRGGWGGGQQSVVSEITMVMPPPVESLEFRDRSIAGNSAGGGATPGEDGNNVVGSSAGGSAQEVVSEVDVTPTANCESAAATALSERSPEDPPSSSAVVTTTTTETAIIAKAEPMGNMSVVICNRHIRLRWWHFVILIGIIAIICVVVGVLVSRPSPPPAEELNWLQKTDDLPTTITNILLDKSIISNDQLNNTSSPQYQALEWMTNDGGAQTITTPKTVDEATPYVIQRYIMAVLYYSTTGPKWKDQFGFLSNVNECEWGVGANNGYNVVDCNDDGFVTLINLWSNNLGGGIPKELVYMTNVTALDFLTNNLGGELPVEITRMVQLDYLNLGYNQFSGTIMSEFGNLEKICKLCGY